MICVVRRYWQSALAAAAVCLTAGCAEDPTEVVVSVVSDLPCESSSVAAVAVGVPGELGDRAASGTSTVCNPDGSRGDVVVVPKAAKGSEFAVEVRIRADGNGSVDDCTASSGYQNCIVARRILNFIPGRTVHMRVDLRNPCVNTPCSQVTTCIAQGTSKSCLEAKVDVNKCSGTCDEGTIITQHPDPVDQCVANPCDDSATCQVTEGAVECVCATGFQHPKNNALACEDIDECVTKARQCDVHATCKNTAGSATCACNEGYASDDDGATCTQVECAAQCATDGACVKNRANKFNCTCLPGYSGNGVTCTNIDECKTGVSQCDPLAQCFDTHGSYQCDACPAGYLDANADGTECIDIDECADKTANCSAKAKCTNTPGAFACACPAGFTDVNGDGTECIDVDECSLRTANCAAKATCTNSEGAFTCQCVAGLKDVKGDGTVCTESCTTPTNQVPVMTSNTTPSGEAVSSGDFDVTFLPWRAFDATVNMWISSTNQASVLLEYDWPDTPRRVVNYLIAFTNGAGLATRAPRDWTLAGWNGTAWVIVDTRTNEMGWDVTSTRSYVVTTPGNYLKYRLVVTQDNDDRPGPPIVAVSIGTLQLNGCNVLP